MAIIIEPAKPDATGLPHCQLCGGRMVKKTLGRGIFMGILTSLFCLCLGIVLCFFPLGFLLGIPLILIGLFYGGKRQKVLMCTACRATVGRA